MKGNLMKCTPRTPTPHAIGWNGKFGGIMRSVEKDIDKLMQRILRENTKRMCASRERASKTTIPLFEMYGNLFKREKVVIPVYTELEMCFYFI
jgi:hypothetical protein